MAMTSAEKMTKYRQRLKEAGGKTFAIDIAGKRLEWIEGLTEIGKTEVDVVRKTLNDEIDRQTGIYRKVAQIREMGGTQEQIERFYQDCKPTIPDISNYVSLEANND